MKYGLRACLVGCLVGCLRASRFISGTKGGARVRWAYFSIGIVFLLVGSYLDNVRGPLIPALIQQATFNYQSVSQILIWGHLTAFVVTWLLIPGLNRVS
ncbi:MAG: hypothetical protein NTV34_14155, partial [Proteobacteria bacterium]|nr:hypothetical protein [Pseudomonadota bacterium]